MNAQYDTEPSLKPDVNSKITQLELSYKLNLVFIIYYEFSYLVIRNLNDWSIN
jgi:hypothetical protein